MPKGKRREKGCGVFLPEHMLKLAMSELELMLQKGSLEIGFNTS